MRVLISGAGIAGPTLAFWLARYGFEVTIVEVAPELRRGGYIIDFWGGGYDIVERMNLLAEVRRRGYMVREVRVVGRDGRRVAGFSAESFGDITHGRFISLPRGELAAAIFNSIEKQVESIFADAVESIEQSDKSVRVLLKSGARREFDLVIGADGLHSRTRALIFGEAARFEKYLGYKVAAFEVCGYRPRDELVYVMYTQVGQQVARFALNEDRTMFLFTFADKGAGMPAGFSEQKDLLRKRFGTGGWECPQILEALDRTEDLYFDRVSQIRMAPKEGWSKGRVALVGDAAFCVSLLAGQGSALAVMAAYVLAGELYRANGDYRRAFVKYQELFGPFILKKQQAALRFAGTFAPKSQFALFMRNQIMNLMGIRWIANLAFGRDLADRIAIPDYETKTT
ncbi:MAG TPA: FAD-binding domain [Acidobacteriaceae bacterium]|nr:FAD-binding domain [Acidobacteriaceae bacterium]